MSFEPNWTSPPGATISRLMEMKEIDHEEMADGLGLASAELTSLIKGETRISGPIANALSENLGSTPRFWIARDQTYVAEVRRLHEAAVDMVAWAKAMPVRSMKQYRWISTGARAETLYSALLDFFGCQSLRDWNSAYSSRMGAVAFRTSASFAADEMATLVWLRVGEKLSGNRKLVRYDADAFRELLPKLRKLSAFKHPKTFLPRLQKACESVGVAVTTARAPDGCRASGASWFSSDGNPIIHLSFRHRSEDHFWFTFFHEAAHVLLHGGDHIDLDGVNPSLHSSTAKEAEADEFAQNILIPFDVREALIRQATPKKILAAAKATGITSGIIVGQLEKAGAIPHGRLSSIKRRYKWADDPFVPELS